MLLDGLLIYRLLLLLCQFVLLLFILVNVEPYDISSKYSKEEKAIPRNLVIPVAMLEKVLDHSLYSHILFFDY